VVETQTEMVVKRDDGDKIVRVESGALFYLNVKYLKEEREKKELSTE